MARHIVLKELILEFFRVTTCHLIVVAYEIKVTPSAYSEKLTDYLCVTHVDFVYPDRWKPLRLRLCPIVVELTVLVGQLLADELVVVI